MGGDDVAVSLLHIRLETLISPKKGALDKSWPFYGVLRLAENAHLLRYPHPSSLRRTSMYASFLGISEAPVPRAGSATERDFAKLNLHLDIFHQPLRSRFIYSLVYRS
jgi:hypothetical protein